MSKEYEEELEKTIEHLHKVIEEKTTIIDQQKQMLDMFIKGELSSHPGYIDAPSCQGVGLGNGLGNGNGNSAVGYNVTTTGYNVTTTGPLKGNSSIIFASDEDTGF
jgi:hypothetical protein